MDDFIKITEYFKNQNLINTDIENGFILKKFDDTDISYLIKGQSKIKKDFLLIILDCIYILDYCGNIKYKIDIHSIDPLFKNLKHILAWNILQLDENHYSFMIFDAVNFKTRFSCLVIAELNKETGECKAIRKYQLLHTTKYRFPDKHAYYVKDFDHIYLVGIDDNNTFIQEQQNNKVIWQWSVNNYIDASSLLVRTQSRSKLHLNSFTELDDSTLLLSFRNAGIGALNKKTGRLSWFIGKKQNDFNFNTIPSLQHHINFISDDKTQFTVFNNNWWYRTDYIEKIINEGQISLEEFNHLKYSTINLYDLKLNQSQQIKLNSVFSPRMGSVFYLGNNIYDINYGDSFYYKDKTLYRFGLVEERDIVTNEINFCIKANDNFYTVPRGL